ncbi:saccharopine dehydrogenase NADP-binding domain-containing protein [Marinobacteraceae bacterium S3BR75-40.1]
MSTKAFDVVVFGATSFVGKILCRYLVDTYGVDGELKWAAAARSSRKLEALKSELGDKASDLTTLIADANDEASLARLTEKTRVVISTVGPYALYGEPMVKVCVESGTDYCDLTGEVQWIRRMIQKYERKARASGARIVHCCGFDSIPSDMGVYFLQQQAKERLGQPCGEVKMRVKVMKGGMSGGTVASLMNVVKEASANPQLRKELANPYSLCSEEQNFSTRQHNVKGPEYDQDFDAWVTPFVMAAINTRIVFRSNALRGAEYGQAFKYEEAMLTGKGFKGRMTATSIAAGMGGFMLGAAIKPTRWLLERFVVPKPGEGPSEEEQEQGFYDLRFVGKTHDGQTLRTKVTGDRDPGYGSTSKMLGQAGACLALDIAKEDKPGGFWTPSTIFGDALLQRLQSNAGLTFEVL